MAINKVSRKALSIEFESHLDREKPHIDFGFGLAYCWWSKNRDLDLKAEEFCDKINKHRDNPSTKGA